MPVDLVIHDISEINWGMPGDHLWDLDGNSGCIRRTPSLQPPRRRPNAERPSRDYFTPDEIVELLPAAGRVGRYGPEVGSCFCSPTGAHYACQNCGATLGPNRLQSRIGARCSREERCALDASTRGPELRVLREHKRNYPDTPYLFVTERDGPMTAATVGKLIARAGVSAELIFPVHPHELRYSAGYKSASDGQDTRAVPRYLGRTNITDTVRCHRFTNFFILHITVIVLGTRRP